MQDTDTPRCAHARSPPCSDGCSSRPCSRTSDVLPGRYAYARTALRTGCDRRGDRGLVTGGLGTELRARLEAGLVRIRHDKGGEFVFARIGEDRLLGLDDWNRYALYRRDGDKASCAAPVVFEETPLIEDYPQPGTATADTCCARGSLHGCTSRAISSP